MWYTLAAGCAMSISLNIAFPSLVTTIPAKAQITKITMSRQKKYIECIKHGIVY